MQKSVKYNQAFMYKLPITSMVKLQEAVKLETGERTVNATVVMPTSASPPSCLAHTGFDSTYLKKSIFDFGWEKVTTAVLSCGAKVTAILLGQ